VNQFESSVFPQYPEILNIKDQLYAQGAVYASMSGSGSSVFGLFNEPPASIGNLFPSSFLTFSQKI
jgi:4-diphosphocytidyl-2-C-methyl-D-erythritol kinase